MVRSVSQILTRASTFAPKSLRTPTNSSRLVTLRNESSYSQTDLDPNNPVDSSDTTSSVETTFEIIEEAIHCIVVRRAAPGWLPFRPGSSYWVPPSSIRIPDLMDNLSNSLTQEELMSLTTLRGWPSSAFFVNVNDASQDPVGVETISQGMPQSEEEEE